MYLYHFIKMNITVFWILFISLWAIVPLMIIKGRKDEPQPLTNTLKREQTKKGWFK